MPFPDGLPIVVSFSGGRTSAYMLRLLLDNYPKAKIYVVFANTGKECEETLAFVQECSERWNVHINWIEAVVHPDKGVGTGYRFVDFATADRTGRVFEDVIAKYGIPNKPFPHCSRELKIQPIKKLLQDTFGHEDNYHEAVGIRFDESQRAKGKYYPLIEWGITKQQVRAWWRTQPFDLQLKDYEGNCDLCWKKNLRKTLTVIEQTPKKAEWWHEMEERYGHISNKPTATARRHHFHHQGRSTADLVALVKRGRFQRILDEEDKTKRNPFLDLELSCSCGVE
ncbi:phosphoadenosine phosphosulfate reductase domain-containing protein [Hymenobacter siberiensis]|uniref:phosphoadenosine phosphosulfate reductase domain-containing protein n=1 Tax=Hymenobacter siberiensis TaxID=2848396 RepID=UPI001C1E744A|nr:phosphoadenosine phosphosulfate reductase family protein [Hymenobacter siberiensis]